MRKLGVVVVVAGVALAGAARGAAAQATTGERFQAPNATAQAQPAPAVVAPAVSESAPAPVPSAVVRFGPSAEGARLLAPAQVAADEPRLAHTPAYRSREGVPLMIVGGALFLAGAIIGDRAGDAVMVGGVVVAAIGLYEYLQ